jgi:hypothetical protein
MVYLFQVPSPIGAFQGGLGAIQHPIMFHAFDPTKVGSSSTQATNMSVTKKEAVFD